MGIFDTDPERDRQVDGLYRSNGAAIVGAVVILILVLGMLWALVS